MMKLTLSKWIIVDMNNDKKYNDAKDSKKLLKEILENQKKTQTLLKVVIVLLLTLVIAKCFIIG